MKNINRLLVNICSDDLQKSKAFYTQLFNLQAAFESDWFIQLRSGDDQFELGIIQRTNDLVPATYQNKPNGFYLTFVVDNVDEVFELAKEKAFQVVSPPEDTFYGQRRMLLSDPDGTLVDVSSLIQ